MEQTGREAVDKSFYANWEIPSMKLVRLAPIAVLACAMLAAACANTVRGVGQDVKETANAVEDTVE